MTRFLIVLVFSISLSGAVLADEQTGIARDIIESQINAFIEDDVDKAYAYAAPGIRRMYPDPERFMKMVQTQYSAIYRPGHIEFGRSSFEPDNGTIVQELLVTGQDGRSWQAIYVLQRQEDGSYRISGVQMRQVDMTRI